MHGGNCALVKLLKGQALALFKMEAGGETERAGQALESATFKQFHEL
jgi:hypothetical protein